MRSSMATILAYDLTILHALDRVWNHLSHSSRSGLLIVLSRRKNRRNLSHFINTALNVESSGTLEQWKTSNMGVLLLTFRIRWNTYSAIWNRQKRFAARKCVVNFEQYWTWLLYRWNGWINVWSTRPLMKWRTWIFFSLVFQRDGSVMQSWTV